MVNPLTHHRYGLLSEGQFDSVGRFEDDPLIEQKDIIMVMDVAIDLARLEMELVANLQLKILNMNDFML